MSTVDCVLTPKVLACAGGSGNVRQRTDGTRSQSNVEMAGGHEVCTVVQSC